MDMHPEVKSLLAGMAWRDSSIGSADMANLNRAWQEVAETAYITKEMKEWAQWCLRCGSGARPHFRTTGGSQDVPDQLLIRALMNIWRDRLKRPLTNWAQERRDFTLNASQLTKFVGAFLSIAGACPRNKPLSPQAIRQRIRRAKKLMD